MALPVLSAQQQIVDTATGKPTSQFLRFMEELRTGIIAADADIQAQLDRLTAFLAGTGEQITGSGAFAASVVTTAKVASNAITSEASAFTAATLAQSGASETTVQTVTYVSTGETIEVRANFFMTVWHPAAGGITTTIRIYRGATMIYEQAFVAINGDLLQGWQTPTVIEDPAAGSHTYTVTVQASTAGYATAETSSRLLAAREFKR